MTKKETKTATPPRRGIGLLCIFLGAGLSIMPFSVANFLTIIVTKADNSSAPEKVKRYSKFDIVYIIHYN